MTATPETAAIGGSDAITTASRRSGDRSRRTAQPPAGGAVYGLGMIGALVYFLVTAQSGLDYVLALGKAVLWPVILVYEAFQALDR